MSSSRLRLGLVGVAIAVFSCIALFEYSSGPSSLSPPKQATHTSVAPRDAPREDPTPTRGRIFATFAPPVPPGEMRHLNSLNAISSWAPHASVIMIFVENRGECDFWQQHPKVMCTSACRAPAAKKLTFDCIFWRAWDENLAKTLVLVDVNIILPPNFLDVIQATLEQHNHSLIVGQARGCLSDEDRPIDFAQAQWLESVQQHVVPIELCSGDPSSLISPLSYAVLRGDLDDLLIPFPSFLVDAPFWDNYLLWKALFSSEMATVDATESIPAIHQESWPRWRVNASSAALNEALASRLTRGTHALAKVANADWVLNGSCSVAAPCAPLPNMQSEFAFLLERYADARRRIALIAISPDYLDFALNWACYTKGLNFQNYLFYTADYDTFAALRRADIHCYFLDGLTQVDAHYDDPRFQELMLLRTQIVLYSLQLDFNTLTADVDTLWLDNPFDHIPWEVEVTGQQHKKTQISGGFVYVKATDSGKQFWHDVTECQKVNLKTIQDLTARKKPFHPSAYTEQNCINDLLLTDKYRDMPSSTLGPLHFPDGKAFFEDMLPQKSGSWPAVIHNNWIIGFAAKRERFQDWNLWLLDENLHCKPTSGAMAVAALTPPPSSVRLVLKVLTYNRPSSLERLLESLTGANYGGNPVDLEIFVDAPKKSASTEDGTAARECATLANNFAWTHGSKAVHVRENNVGLVGQWLGAWTDPKSDEVAMIIEDDIEMSPHFYTVIRSLLDRYYTYKLNYDPRLYGIALQAQHAVLGLPPQKAYGSIRIPEVIASNTPNETSPFKPYLYQLPSTWAPLLFPGHWRQFLEWMQAHLDGSHIKNGSTPFFSNLISNEWYASSKKEIWSCWFIRFIAEKGWYSMYLNLVDNAALVLNHREAGIHFNVHKGPMNGMITELPPDGMLFDVPPPQDLDLYDFHFNRLQNRNALQFRSLLFPPGWTGKKS